MLDRQAVYERVVAHLREQREKSLLEGGHECAYRGAGGMRCAIGCLIPDAKYDPRMESRRCPTTFEPTPGMGTPDKDRFRLILDVLVSELGVESDDDLLFLRRLQVIHDSEPVWQWNYQLQWFADKYDLKYVPFMDFVGSIS